jgi:hypothetical protein
MWSENKWDLEKGIERREEKRGEDRDEESDRQTKQHRMLNVIARKIKKK